MADLKTDLATCEERIGYWRLELKAACAQQDWAEVDFAAFRLTWWIEMRDEKAKRVAA